MKPKLCIYSQSNYLSRTAIEAKILFAVCLSKCGFWSESVKTPPKKSPCSKKIGAESAVPILVYFYIIMINKYRQSAVQSCLKNNLSDVFPLTDRTFGNRRGKYKEIGKKVPQAYRVYYKMALSFSANLKGAKSEPVEGYTEHVTRYNKNGKYIDIDIDRNIISFGLLE